MIVNMFEVKEKSAPAVDRYTQRGLKTDNEYCKQERRKLSLLRWC